MCSFLMFQGQVLVRVLVVLVLVLVLALVLVLVLVVLLVLIVNATRIPPGLVCRIIESALPEYLECIDYYD